jgi:hypothetical protein
VHVRPAGSAAGMIVTLELATAGDIEFIGAVPKAVSLYGLACGPDASGRWSASMTVDV